MLRLFVAVCLFFCSTQVLCNVEVGAYQVCPQLERLCIEDTDKHQTLWLWYAYRMDGMTSNPTMALGCKPQNAEKYVLLTLVSLVYRRGR